MQIVMYYLFLIIELIVTLGIAMYLVGMVYSSVKGAPFVSTSRGRIKEILKFAHLKPRQTFVELGCGDGRVVREAVRQFQVQGIGIDINPIFIVLSKSLARLENLPVQFKKQNAFSANLTKIDVLYLFLMPKFIENLIPKMINELPKGSLVISHGFSIPSWSDRLEYTLDGKPFPTYYYRMK